MGDRSTIVVTSKQFSSTIDLYGHWSGKDNVKAVAEVLENTGRIGDPSYLTAQLFHTFATKFGDYDGQLGFGIGAYSSAYDASMFSDDNPPIMVNADTGDIGYNGDTFTKDEFLSFVKTLDFGY